VSMAFIACLESPTSSPNCSCVSPRCSRNSFILFFIVPPKVRLKLQQLYKFSFVMSTLQPFSVSKIFKTTENDPKFQYSFHYYIHRSSYAEHFLLPGYVCYCNAAPIPF